MGISRRVVRLGRIRTQTRAAASLTADAVRVGGGTAITAGPQRVLARLPDQTPIAITISPPIDAVAEARNRYLERGDPVPAYLLEEPDDP